MPKRKRKNKPDGFYIFMRRLSLFFLFAFAAALISTDYIDIPDRETWIPILSISLFGNTLLYIILSWITEK
jgi:hypothetical protein